MKFDARNTTMKISLRYEYVYGVVCSYMTRLLYTNLRRENGPVKEEDGSVVCVWLEKF